MTGKIRTKTYIGLNNHIYEYKESQLRIVRKRDSIQAKGKQKFELYSRFTPLLRTHLDALFGKSTADTITIIDSKIRVPKDLLGFAVKNVCRDSIAYPLLISKGLSYHASIRSNFGSWQDLIMKRTLMVNLESKIIEMTIVPSKTLVWLKKDYSQKGQLGLYFCIRTTAKDKNEQILAMLPLSEVKIEDEVEI